MATPATPQSILVDLIQETVEEDVIELLEEAVLEFDSIHESSELKDLVLQKLATGLLNEVLTEEFIAVSGQCFDDIITVHHRNLSAVQRLNSTLQHVTHEMIEEIVLEIIDTNSSRLLREEILESILQEVVEEELELLAAKVLDHYRARVALLQYKQMQVTASDVILDKFLLQALVSQYGTGNANTSGTSLKDQDCDSVLDEILLQILLSQSIALHTCLSKSKPVASGKHGLASVVQAKDCLPLKWYKKKLTSAIAEEVVVSALCERLDESMHIASKEKLKKEAVSLFNEYLNT